MQKKYAVQLPQIPAHTPAGIRARAIADTLRAVVRETGEPTQTDHVARIAKSLNVPQLWVESIVCGQMGEAHVAELIAWRNQLADVAPNKPAAITPANGRDAKHARAMRTQPNGNGRAVQC